MGITLVLFRSSYMPSRLPKQGVRNDLTRRYRSGLSAERTLRGGYFILGARIDRHGRSQRARQTFEARLGYMVIVAAVQSLCVQRDAGVHGESLKPFLDQLGVEITDLVAHERSLEHEKRST